MCDPLAQCVNAAGSYSCACSVGFTGDGFHCSDADECASRPCDRYSSCVNTNGSYACACRSQAVQQTVTAFSGEHSTTDRQKMWFNRMARLDLPGKFRHETSSNIRDD